MSYAPTTTDLGRVIVNPVVRAYIYGTYVIALVAANATTVGYAALSVDFPDWLIVTTAVLTFLGIPVGTLAVANIKPKAEAAAESADITSVNPANE